MALFLPIILTVSSFITINSPYQRQAGILGGPSAAAAEAVYSGDNIAMLASMPSPAQFTDEMLPSPPEFPRGILETALLFGGEQTANGEQIAQKSAAPSSPEAGPDLGGYFSMPTRGFNWGKLHSHNAVDIANACGTTIVAAADGLVNETSLDGWNGGYGHYVLIAHPNGTKTRYAHMEKISTSVGLYVKQGETIGTMGRTGDATGCHVHFEVLGAVNPFASS